MPETILVIDDEKLICWSIKKEFEKKGFQVLIAHDGATGFQSFLDRDPDVILLDIRLPDRSGIEVLKEMLQVNREAIIILITAFGGVASAVTAIKEGAYDYIEKPFKLEHMEITINRALEKIRLKDHVRELTNLGKGKYPNMIAQSAIMKEVISLAKKVAATDSTTVLLQGESGTGKDLLAKVIHSESVRAQKPYVEIDCPMLPDTLIESELFGFEKGSFTDAKRTKKGLFETADGGTVYVNEIGEVKLNTQVKLLRVLEEKKFKHLGGSSDINVDVRVIAATNRNLASEIEKGNFRQDLFYRLNVLNIYLPPLRERKEDILPIAKSFLANFNKKYKKEVSSISPEAEALLWQYYWPGNIRELKNIMEHIVIINDTDIITPEHLPAELKKFPARLGSAQDAEQMPGGFNITVPLEGIDFPEIEKEFIRQALITAGGNKTRAAKLLNITRDVMRSRLLKLED